MGLISHESQRARRIDRAVADLIDSGSQVGYQWEYLVGEQNSIGNEYHFFQLEAWKARPNLAGMFGDAFYSDVAFLHTTNRKIDARWLANFNEIPQLEMLLLRRCDLTTVSWQDTPDLPNLRYLWIESCEVPPSFDQMLRRCPNLEVFRADDTRLAPDQIQTICAHPNLRVLDLRGQAISREAFHNLSRAEHLKFLILDDTNVGDEVLELVSLPKLRSLSLRGTNLSDEGVAGLQASQSNVHVNLDRTKHASPWQSLD